MINMKVTGDSVEERIEKFNSFKDSLPNYVKKGVQINVADNVTALRTREETDGTLHKEWQFTHNLVTSTGDIYYANKIAGRRGDGTAYVDAGAAGAGFAGDGHLFHHPTATSVGAVSDGSTSSVVYGAMILGTATTTPDEGDTYGVSGSSGTTFSSGALDASGAIDTTKTLTDLYPRFGDDDADNTGGYVSASALGTDQVTWAYSWTKGNFATASSTDLTGGVIVDRANNATPASTAKLLCHFNFASPFEKTANDTLKVFVNHTFEGAA
tara:strand:- start:4210 stop:5016 length:807 start_codon:yes stop_codon:yes gene_type:complete